MGFESFVWSIENLTVTKQTVSVLVEHNGTGRSNKGWGLHIYFRLWRHNSCL